jgi:hypothetical protein
MAAAPAAAGREADEQLPAGQEASARLPSGEPEPGQQRRLQQTKAAFEALVRAEFARIMAAGDVSANEAAARALAAARQSMRTCA